MSYYIKNYLFLNSTVKYEHREIFHTLVHMELYVYMYKSSSIKHWWILAKNIANIKNMVLNPRLTVHRRILCTLLNVLFAVN